MKVFASQFLEPLSNNTVGKNVVWGWTPNNPAITKIYATGANTKSRESTYAAEKDNRSDDDRPDEGRSFMIAQ